MQISRRYFRRAYILWVLFAVGSASAARAQGSAPSEAGFQPNRDYLALLPFEAIDTASNNVLLTFTDLVLPGNGGRELRFQRVFSNQVVQDPGGPQWRFGIAGVPMRVVERPYPQSAIEPPGDFTAERLTTPYFWMLDGSRLETTYVSPPAYQLSPTLVEVQTPNFWRYNRQTRILRIPDGTAAQYNEDGYLIKIWDPFDNNNTNVVTLTWGSVLQVVQSLGNGETREVLVDIDDSTGLPKTLTYDGREWTYTYDSNEPGQLRQVDPPLGPAWAYEYSTETFSSGKVTRITTPQGGEVEYAYGDREFYVPGSPRSFPDVFNVLVTRRAHDQGQLLGEWIFEHSAVSDLAFDRTVVTLPSGTTVEYGYGPWSTHTLAGTWLLTYRSVKAPDGSTLETEAREYDLLQGARKQEAWGVPRLVQRTTTREGQSYTTEYSYANDESNFSEYHHPTTITERGPSGGVERTTHLEYQHLPNVPHVLGLPKSESTTMTGMMATKTSTYNQTTGFRETETLYGIATSFVPDPFGNIATATTANGKATSFTYSWGVLSQTSTPGVVVTREINPHGTVASETVAGRITTYEYDARFRLERTNPPGGTNPIMTVYDNTTGLMATTSRDDSFVTTIVDGFGRPIATENSVGVRTRTAYDAEGRKTYQSLPFEGAFDGPADTGTHFVYDPLGRVTQEINPDDTIRRREYDDATNTVTVRDDENRLTVFTYRAFGHPDDARLVSVIDASAQEWTYTYDAIGNIAQVVTPTGETRTWLRNGALLTQETHPESGTVFYTQYDAAGVLKRKVDANGTEFVYTHDGNDRVTRITAGTRVTNVAYEPGSNNRLSMSNGDVSTTFAYDPAGRVAQRQDVPGSYVFTSSYAYDGNDQVTAITYPSGRIVGYDRETDSEGRITRVFETAVGRDYAFGLTYHPSGALGSYTAGNLIPTTIDYDPQRYWVTSIQSGALGLTYGDYDAVGNVRTIGDSRGGMDQTFTYDVLHRLETANGPYGFAGYAYDAHGNRRTVYGIPYVYEADTLRLASFSGIPYTYDNNGSLKTAGGDTFNYTGENMLALATVSGGVAITYAYDADQWRLRRTTQGETTYYLRGLHGELLTEWRIPATGDSTIRDYVYAGTRLLSVVEKTTVPPTPNDTYGTIVPNGPAVTAIISTAGRRVLLQFTGIAGHRYRAAAWLTSGQFGCGSWLELRTAAGDLVANTTSGPSCSSLLLDAVVLPASGTYYVVIDPLDTNTGTASVRLYDIYAVITPNGPKVTVPVNTNGQRLLVEFAGTQGQQYSAVTDIVAGAGGCGYRPEIRTATWALVPTARASNGCTFVMDVMEAGVLPSTWTHFAVLDPIATSQHNSAQVWLYEFVDVTTAIPTDGTAVVAPLTKPGQRALLPFGGTAGQRIAARVVVTSGNLGCSWWLEILRPDNSYFPSYVGTCNGTYAFHEPVSLATPGTYRVLVDPYRVSTGTASVTAYAVPADVTGTLTINAPAVPVTLTGVGQQGRISFQGTGGQSVTVRLANNTMGQTTVRLLRPNGTWQTYATSSNSSFTLPATTLASTGTYTVLVDPNDLNAGSLSVQVTSP